MWRALAWRKTEERRGRPPEDLGKTSGRPPEDLVPLVLHFGKIPKTFGYNLAKFAKVFVKNQKKIQQFLRKFRD